MRKRILSVMLTIAMLMSVVSPTYVFAEIGDAISFRLEASEVDGNNEVTVKLYADKNDGVVGFQAIVSIDTDTFEIDEDSEWYDMPTSLLKTDVHSVNLSPDKSVLSFIVAHSKTISTTGELLWFKMKVKNTATSGKKAISFITTGDAVTKYVVIIDDVETGFEVKSLTNTSVTVTIPVTGITINGADSITGIGNTAKLTVEAQPANATQPNADMSNVAWSTNKEKVATVENGIVTAVGEGTATITAVYEDQTATKVITVKKAALTGEVTIDGNAVYGVKLTANYNGEADNPIYTWYREGKVISTENTYTITKDDIDKVLTVRVSSDNFAGNVSAKTEKVQKAPQNAPAKPIIEAKENKIIVTNPNNNVEYRLGSTGKFGMATEFNVEYDKSYYVEARYPETATHKASDIVKSDPVKTPKAPRNLTVTASAGGEVEGAPTGEVREGQKVELTAAPDNDHKFVEWEAKGVTLTEEEAKATEITFTMGKNDVEIKAKFKEKDAVSYGFGEAEFIYNGNPQAPTFNPASVKGMTVEVTYNGSKDAPIYAGKYTMQVTYTPNNADSDFKTTVAKKEFVIKKANQTEPAAPTVTVIESDSFVVAFDEKQEYAINTTGDAPTEWAATITTTSLNPATDYYVFTRVKGDDNHKPSPAASIKVTTAHTYEWKLDDTNNAVATVRVGADLPPEMTATIKNIGTGELTGITAIIGNEKDFTLETVPATLASKDDLVIKVKPKGITSASARDYTATVTVKAKDVGDITINFTIKVTAKETAVISGINDTTVIFNGETQGIDLSKAVVTGGGETLDANKLTVTYDATETRNAGEYIATIKYEDDDYIGSTTAKLTINKKEVTVEGFKAQQSKVYDGNADAEVDSTNAKLDGMIEGTAVGFDKSGLKFTFADKNVGTNKTVKNTADIKLTGADADNYNLKNPTVELTADITAKPVTVTATVEDKTYDGLKNNAVVKLSAPELIKGDQVQFDNVTGTYVTADAGDAVEVKVTYIIGGEDASNYSLNVVKTATGKVKKAELNVTLTAPAAVTYDGKTHGVSDVKDNRVEADKDKTLYTLTYNDNDALPVDADTYEVTAKLTNEGRKNYNLFADIVELVIKKADMTATNQKYTVAFMLAGAQTRKLNDLQLTPANVSGEWSVVTGTNEILDGDAKIDGANLVFNIKSGLTTDDIGKKAELTLTFTPEKNYNTVTATVTVTLANDTYENSISPALPTQVKLGEALNLSGVKLVTKFGSGAPEQQLDVNDAAKVEVTSTYNPAATGETALGVKTVTFTDKANGGITYTHSFTVVDVLKGVELEANPTAYNYKLKEASSIGFDGKVHAVYKSGVKKALNHADVVLTMSDGTVVDSAKEARLLNTLGTATITLTYTEKYFDGTTDKQSVAITVSVTADPVKPDGKPNAEGFAVTPIPDAGKKMEYKDDEENEVKPEDVQGKLAYADPGALEGEVKNNPAFNNVGNGDVVYENISFKDENGKSVTFANGKMQVTVPYPADSKKGDEFVMLIPDGEGKMKAIVPQKTADGLQFEIENSNVTFAIGWYTPAPSPVLPTEPERDPEDNFWNEVYWTLLRSGQGSVITANAGYYDRVPQGVLRAVDISGNTLIINSAFGMQVVVNPGALEKLGMYRIFYPISYLNEMLRGGKISGSGTTGITVGVLMPTTGDATVVEHPYTMTPANAGFIKGMENTANARPVIETADGVDVLEGAQRNDGAVIGGGMLIVLGLLALLGAAYVTMRRRGSRN